VQASHVHSVADGLVKLKKLYAREDVVQLDAIMLHVGLATKTFDDRVEDVECIAVVADTTPGWRLAAWWNA
jgi:hypothetical protein